ncbi:putative transcription factor IIIC, subunit 5 [Rosa chinensis]|uniref:Putative transcription factor IIIC, subunit 5 n=1 Tax=Rosa chinensis TaxID=74649 RepID=A0A2P6RHV8_ROSCH|nr:putative transcription factor IIIC, subunit 5 [Rosa chinensis]
MGVVKDGTISGFLPSSQVFGVHYPGYPSSISRAIDTLGGTQAIHKAHSSHSNNNNRLELHFRHDDPYSHPAFADLRPCNSFLLKISKTKSAGGQNDQVSVQDAHNLDTSIQLTQPERDLLDGKQPETDQVTVCADIVARVPQAYHFDGMVDYQHVIAVHADVARKRKRNRVETEEPHFDRGGLMDIDQEDVMILLPQLFAPKDVPDNLVVTVSQDGKPLGDLVFPPFINFVLSIRLKPSGTLSVKKNQEEPVQHQPEMDMEPVLAIDFGITDILMVYFSMLFITYSQDLF